MMSKELFCSLSHCQKRAPLHRCPTANSIHSSAIAAILAFLGSSISECSTALSHLASRSFLSRLMACTTICYHHQKASPEARLRQTQRPRKHTYILEAVDSLTQVPQIGRHLGNTFPDLAVLQTTTLNEHEQHKTQVYCAWAAVHKWTICLLWKDEQRSCGSPELS